MHRKLLLLFILLLAVGGPLLANSPELPAKKVHYEYLTYLPQNYDSTRHTQYPLLIYLHGSSVKGNDLNKVRRYGLPYFLDRGKKLDYLVVAPQCPWGKRWSSENWLDSMLEELDVKYQIDKDRIYLTGISLGGFGTWELANLYPNTFAAIAPVCGGGKPEYADHIYHLPTWVFHGVQDKLVSVFRADQMVDELKKYDACVKYTRYRNKGHNLHRVFDNDELYQWFSQFTRRPLNDDQAPLPPLTPIWLSEMKQPAPMAPLQPTLPVKNGKL